jgi:nitroreductase
MMEQMNLIFQSQSEDLRTRAQVQAGYLFRWVAGQILLGNDISEELDWLAAQLDNFQPTGVLTRDLGRWLCYLATAALLELPVSEQAQHGHNYLRSGKYSEEDYSIVQAGLALSVLGGQQIEARAWLDKEYALAPHPEAEVFAFEMMVLAAASLGVETYDIGFHADSVARVFLEALWSAPTYSAAPHIGVLASLCSMRKCSLRSLLFGRIPEMDARMFVGKHRKVYVSPPDLVCETKAGSPAVLTISTNIAGKGALEPGLDVPSVLSSGLITLINSSWLDVGNNHYDRMPTKFSSPSLGNRLSGSPPFQSVRVVLNFDPDITASAEALSYMRHRFRVAWLYVRNQLSDLDLDVSFVVGGLDLEAWHQSRSE